mmetsp:Transcript_19076/g.19204  ORF Transcript_19076/g.19204 Transcript_19076/m.19204 type:complete len:91 (+) Transcript_19076:105-377(+)
MASLLKPIFHLHEVKLARIYGNFLIHQATKASGWGVPLIIGAAWFIFPAIPRQTRESLVFGSSSSSSSTPAGPIKYESDEIDKMPTIVEN